MFSGLFRVYKVMTEIRCSDLRTNLFFSADEQCSCTACLFSVACGVAWLGGSFQRLQVASLEIIAVRAAARGLSEAFLIS